MLKTSIYDCAAGG